MPAGLASPCQHRLLIAARGLQHLGLYVVALARRQRAVAKNVFDHPYMLGVVDRDRGRGAVSEQMRVYRVPEMRSGNLADPKIDRYLGHCRAVFREPEGVVGRQL